MIQNQLTKESKEFIEDLRAYLFTQGKNTKEIDDIIQELSDHLYDAEQNGKSIKEVVGKSPKEYMESISTEISNDFISWWFKYIPLIILGAIFFPVTEDMMQGQLSYSLLQIIGYSLFVLVFVSGTFFVVGYTAKNQLSKTKEIWISVILVVICTALFIGTLLMDEAISTPIIDFGIAGKVTLITLMVIFIIVFSIWAKTVFLPVILLAYYLPPILLSYTPLVESLQSIIEIIISLSIIGLYLMFVFKDEDETEYK